MTVGIIRRKPVHTHAIICGGMLATVNSVIKTYMFRGSKTLTLSRNAESVTLILLGLRPDDINRPDLRLFFALLHIIGIALVNMSRLK